jgi:hypothetical protein
MEEYKYRSIHNVSGDNSLLKKLFDSIPESESYFIQSLELEGHCLTIGWYKQIPKNWKNRDTVELSNGTKAKLFDDVSEEWKLVPSLIEALKFLAQQKNNKASSESDTPEDWFEKVQFLNSLKLVSLDSTTEILSVNESRFVGVERIGSCEITDAGRESLKQIQNFDFDE